MLRVPFGFESKGSNLISFSNEQTLSPDDDKSLLLLSGVKLSFSLEEERKKKHFKEIREKIFLRLC